MSGRGRGFSPGGRGGGGRGRDGGGGRYVVLVCVFVLCCVVNAILKTFSNMACMDKKIVISLTIHALHVYIYLYSSYYFHLIHPYLYSCSGGGRGFSPGGRGGGGRGGRYVGISEN